MMEKVNNHPGSVTLIGFDFLEKKSGGMNTATTHASNSAMGRLQNQGIFRQGETNLKQEQAF